MSRHHNNNRRTNHMTDEQARALLAKYKFTFLRTSVCCPEQYDIYVHIDGEFSLDRLIGYMRLRNSQLTVDYWPRNDSYDFNCANQRVNVLNFYYGVDNDGNFHSETDRAYFKDAAKAALFSYMINHKVQL